MVWIPASLCNWLQSSEFIRWVEWINRIKIFYVVYKTAIFLCIQGINYLTFVVSDLFHLTGEISGFLPNFIQSKF